ncbi:M56 family metallopeptidase [Bacteroides sp. UBA939]|uniref:M56 family metallopeptidase n=1 Tax=Bacteroides sp. UBA939 TaxID=1946092 RepID=UPI0025C43165|nr:M56 family metallopeptidase [Bacteroides sp. UBA939]
MGTILFYIFESTLCLFILYFLFRLFFRNDTLFRTNRLLLMMGTVVCTLLPLMQIDISQYTPLQLPVTTVRNLLTAKEAGTVEERITGKEFPLEETSISVESEGGIIESSRGNVMSVIPVTLLLGGCYFLGALVVFISFLLSTIRMYRLIHRFPVHKYGKYRLIICPEKIISFSWGNTIVLSEKDYEKNPEEILLHEQIHLQHRHTLDLLWMECLVIFHWFNPAAWLLMRELREVHEYEADSGVINHGIDATQYQLLLVKNSVGTRLYSMACGFNHSKLKNRITMMLKRRTNNWARLKLLLFVPVAAGTLYAFARPEVKETVEQVMTPASVEQDSIPRSELEQLKAFFKHKAKDAAERKDTVGRKEVYTTTVGRKEVYTTIIIKEGDAHSIVVNMQNRIMLDGEKINDVKTLSARLTDILKKDYEESVKKKTNQIPPLITMYDQGSSADAVTSYLRAIKEAYLQVRAEISEQLGGVSEARLDSLLPISVHFAKPKKYSSSKGR